MGKSSRIDDDEVDGFIAGSVNALNQLVLGIALQAQQVMAALAGELTQVLVDLLQGGGAVNAGLAAAQAIQVRSVQNQDAGHVALIP